MRRLGTRNVQRVLQTAAEEGITHFDTAPMYGTGEAEGLLGRFLASRRDRVTVTTKVGLLPPPAIARILPGRLLRGPLSSGRADFGLGSVRASFERSLKRLGTDYVDLLLLHECTPHQLTDDLLEFLAGCLANGMARAVGTATSSRATVAIAKRWAPFPAVAQVPWSPPGSDTLNLPGPDLPGVITHSSVSFVLSRVWGPMQTRPNELAQWSKELGVDCSRSDVVAGLALALAQRDNSAGPTLFSSRVADHVRATCRQASAYAEDNSRLDRFEHLLSTARFA
jgi:D-threo-aldose 1-dehydrogenase